MLKANQAYMQTKVTTTNQGELVVLLYDGAIKFLNKSKELMEKKDFAGKGNMISKALDVINELDGSLNLEKGGEIAKNLHNLYFFCNSRLLMANLKTDPTIVDEVIKILSGLRDAYAQILNKPEAQAAAAEAAANLPSEPTRAQVGRSTSGAQSSAPLSNARGASLYAKGKRVFEGVGGQQQEPSPTPPVNVSLSANPEQAVSSPPAAEPDAAQLSASSAAPSALTEQHSSQSAPSVASLAAENPGFAAARMAKTALYRKLAANAQ